MYYLWVNPISISIYRSTCSPPILDLSRQTQPAALPTVRVPPRRHTLSLPPVSLYTCIYIYLFIYVPVPHRDWPLLPEGSRQLATRVNPQRAPLTLGPITIRPILRPRRLRRISTLHSQHARHPPRLRRDRNRRRARNSRAVRSRRGGCVVAQFARDSSVWVGPAYCGFGRLLHREGAGTSFMIWYIIVTHKHTHACFARNSSVWGPALRGLGGLLYREGAGTSFII